MPTATIYCPRSEGRALFRCRDCRHVFLIAVPVRLVTPASKNKSPKLHSTVPVSRGSLVITSNHPFSMWAASS